MAREIQPLIEALRRIEPSVEGAGSPEWGSDQPDYRTKLREACPTGEEWSVTRSHAPGYGGWLAVKRPCRIGFDVERFARIQVKVIERVCKADEIAAAPDPAFLWCAKEAFFKALAVDQQTVISQIYIDRWESLEPDVYLFASSRNPRLQGRLTRATEVFFAGVLLAPN